MGMSVLLNKKMQSSDGLRFLRWLREEGLQTDHDRHTLYLKPLNQFPQNIISAENS